MGVIAYVAFMFLIWSLRFQGTDDNTICSRDNEQWRENTNPNPNSNPNHNPNPNSR